MSDDATIAYARNLVTSGLYSGQQLNDKIVNHPDFKRWSNDTLMIGAVCLAAGLARALDLPEEDFVTLSRTAHQLIRAEPKSKLIVPTNGDKP